MFDRVPGGSTFRLDYLLNLLANSLPQNPSSALRVRLETVAARRLKELSKPHAIRHGRIPSSLKPAFAVLILGALGVSAAILVRHHQARPQAGGANNVHVNGAARSGGNDLPAVRVSAPEPHRPFRARLYGHGPPAARRVTMRLPYSNSAINTGTDTTIRVSVSQSELLAMGFPVNTMVHDRRIVAELTLGDDGLPRAISLPLPIEVMKEIR